MFPNYYICQAATIFLLNYLWIVNVQGLFPISLNWNYIVSYNRLIMSESSTKPMFKQPNVDK